MKIIFFSILLAMMLMVTGTGFSQVASPYQVGTWPDFKSCAVSYTFDDGCSGQFSKAIPIFNEFNYKLTLFTVTAWGPNWTNLKNAAANGHEVANHTATHANLSTLSVDKQKEELEPSNNLINSNVTNQKSVTMATPYCAEGNDARASQYFIAVRGCQGFIESKTPGNFMNVSSLGCGNLSSIFRVKDFKTKADQAVTAKGWLVYLIHGIDNDGGYSPLSSDTLKRSLQYLKDNDSKFWVNTFGNAARYIKERNCTSVSETSATETTISVSVTDTLSNNETFNFPLTIRRPLPEGWSGATVTQNGNAVKDTLIEVNSVKYIQFEAIPDGGSVVISKVNINGKDDLKGSLENDLNIWINNREIRFSIPKSCGKNPSVSIYNLKGAKLISLHNVDISEGFGNVSLAHLSFQPGIFLFQLSDNRSVWTKKIKLFSI
jgi:peptidoglycan-N-acetylglucosamine deacetylase